MNNPVRFDQDPEAPEGTGTFRFQDGSELYAMEPDLAKRVSSSVGPQMATAPAKRDVWYDDPADPVQRPGEAAADFTTRAERLQAEATPSELPSLPAGTRAPATSPQTSGVAAGPDGRIMPRIDPFVSTPGVDPERMRRTAVPVPQTISTVTERGAPYSPELAGMREEANQALVEAKLAEFGAQKQAHVNQATELQAQLPALQQEAAAQKAEWERRRGEAMRDRERINRYIADYDKRAQINPNRIYEAGFGFGGMAIILGQALGAYAAVLAGGDNFAQKVVQQRLQADLEAQREDIRQGRVGIDNMLAKLEQEYGDAEQAESAWKILQSQVLEREIQSYQAAAKSDLVDRAAAVWIAQNQAERLREEEKLMQLSLGKQTLTQSEKFISPQGGGRRLKTRAELLKELQEEAEFQKGINEYNAELRGGRPTPQQTRVERDTRKEDIEYGEARRKVDLARDSLRSLAEKAGIKFDPVTGRATLSDEDVPGRGATGFLPDFAVSQQGRDVRQAFEKALSDLIRAKSGATATDQEVERLRTSLGGLWDTGLAQGLENSWRELESEQKNIDATYGRPTVERFDSRGRDVQRKRYDDAQGGELKRY